MSTASKRNLKAHHTLCREKRRASQARHRHAVAACYKQLKAVLPEQDISKVPKQDREHMELLQDALLGAKNNKTTSLNRARCYILHLEAMLNQLLKEHTSQRDEEKPSEGINIDKKHMQCTLNDVRQDFCNNFHFSKPIEQYTIKSLNEQMEAQVLKNHDCCSSESSEDEHTFIQSQEEINCHCSSAMFSPSLFSANAFFVPVVFTRQSKPFPGHYPAGVKASSHIADTSPADASIDLGFVSAENGSQGSIDNDKH